MCFLIIVPNGNQLGISKNDVIPMAAFGFPRMYGNGGTAMLAKNVPMSIAHCVFSGNRWKRNQDSLSNSVAFPLALTRKPNREPQREPGGNKEMLIFHVI